MSLTPLSSVLYPTPPILLPAARFDTDGDGNLTHQEKLAARKIMREEEDKFVFVKASGGAASAAHRVMQRDGQVISEQLDGWAALTRAKMHGAQENQGSTLAFDIAGASSVTATGNAGLVKEKIDVDLDDTDNVALQHVQGQVIDYDNVVIKPQYRPALAQSGATALSDLRHRRKMKQRANLSYDLDGDGMVSQKDYFFAVRFDKDGNGNLDPQEKAAAAEAMRSGFGSTFAFLRGSGPSDANHRVQQRDGVIMSEETDGGWGALAKARLQGDTVAIGADGNLKDGGEAGGAGARPTGRVAHEVVLSDEGKVALKHVEGAVVDYDTVTVKPQFRPALVQSGSRTRSELALRRRKERYPDMSMDLDGDGAVSQADYWFSKRYDVDDNNRLSPDEKEKARRDYDEGYQKRFVTLNSSSGPGMSHRVFQLADGVVLSDGEGVLAGDGAGYDATVRLPTLGVRPALDLPPDRMLPPGAGGGGGGGFNRSGSLAGTYSSVVRGSSPVALPTRPVAHGSIGTVPGVARVILRNPDGTQEAFGGYGGGMGSNPLNNMTGTLEAVMGRPVGAGRGAESEAEHMQRLAATAAARAAESTMMGVGSEQDDVDRMTAAELGVRPFKPDNIGTFSDRGSPFRVHKQAPFALAGKGGAAEAHENDPATAANKVVAADYNLLTRTQLVAARRLRFKTGEGTEADTAAGLRTDSVLGPSGTGGGDDSGAGGGGGSGNSVGEDALRSTLRSTSGAAHLPQYMLQSLANKSQLPVLNDDLPHETVKPGALPEGARTIEAATVTALRGLRVRDAKEAALDLTRQPHSAIAMPELYPPGYNDHHSHGKPLVSEGQASLSKTQTQLEKRRLAERVTESLAFAPPEPYGIHKGPIPSFSKRHTREGLPWYSDKSHLEGATTNFMGSPLDGPAGLAAVATVGSASTGADFRGLPNVIEPIPPQYHPALRHTVRDTALHGTTHTSTASLGDTRAGLGTKAPRLIKDGVLREEEEALAAAGDPFKTRAVNPRTQDRYLRKHGLALPENPGKTDPREVARRLEATVDPSAFRPAYSALDKGADGRPAYMVNKNLGNWANGLPGPRVDKKGVADAAAHGRTWSSAIITYRQMMDAGGADAGLDESGKGRTVDPHDYDPMFSSFSPDNKFHEQGYVKGNMAYQPKSGAKDDRPPRRTSIYGRPVALPALAAAGGAPPQTGGGIPGAGATFPGGQQQQSSALLPPLDTAGAANPNPPHTAGSGGGAGYEVVGTPGGSWSAVGGASARASRAGSGHHGHHGHGGAASHERADAFHPSGRRPHLRHVERAPAPTPIVTTLQEGGGGGDFGGVGSAFGGSGGMNGGFRALGGGVRTGGFRR
jgi:hypothetical protein